MADEPQLHELEKLPRSFIDPYWVLQSSGEEDYSQQTADNLRDLIAWAMLVIYRRATEKDTIHDDFPGAWGLRDEFLELLNTVTYALPGDRNQMPIHGDVELGYTPKEIHLNKSVYWRYVPEPDDVLKFELVSTGSGGAGVIIETQLRLRLKAFWTLSGDDIDRAITECRNINNRVYALAQLQACRFWAHENGMVDYGQALSLVGETINCGVTNAFNQIAQGGLALVRRLTR